MDFLSDKVDVLMAGVGGQGIVLASDILGDVAVAAGLDAKKSDALGMAQRGGTVVSHVRIGKEVHSPLLARGEADFLVGFEKLEGARWASFLRPGGTALLNDYAIPPFSVSSGAEPYPSDETIIGQFQGRAERLFLVPGTGLARELGNPRVLNIVMLGVLSHFLPMEVGLWTQVIGQRVPQRYLELNFQAFARGRAEAEALGKAG